MSVTFSFLAGFFELLPLASSHFCHGQAGKLFNCLPFDLGKKKMLCFTMSLHLLNIFIITVFIKRLLFGKYR